MKRLLLITLATACTLRAQETLSLEDARRMALKNHPDVVAAELDAAAAQEQVNEARSNYFPTANGFVSGVEAGNRQTRILAGGLNNPAIYSRVAEGVAVNALITDFGKTGNLTEGSRSRLKAANEGERETRDQVLLGVDTAYYATLQAKAVLRVAEDTLKVRTLLSDRIDALAKNALKSSLDVSFAKVAKSQAALLLEKAQGDEAGAEAMLSAAMGEPTPHSYALVEPKDADTVIGDEANLSSLALSRRPDLLRLRYERDAAEHDAKAARAANYPTLSAVGVAGTSGSHDYRLPNTYAAGGLQLSIPLFAGGLYVAREKEAQLRAQRADQVLRQKQDLVARDVQITWIAATTAAKRVAIAQDLLENSTQAYNLAKAKYEAGSSSILEVSEAELAQTSASIELADARYSALTERSILDYVTGGVQ